LDTNETVGTSETLTDEGLANVFADLLSDEPEYQETSETPPTQQQPTGSEPESEESDTEPGTEEGESETAEETEESQSEDSPVALDPNLKVKVKVDGVEQEITLGEALKGYSRTSDYTRKTQELASQRKAAEEFVQGLRADREKYAYQLTELERALKDAEPQEPNWVELQKESPEMFAAEWARWSQYKDRMNQLKQERERAEQVVLKDREATVAQQVAAAREKLVELIPEWKDQAKAKAEKAKMVSAATEDYGFTEAELRSVIDPRMMQLLRDATLYRELQKKKPTIEGRISKVKTVTPGPSGASRVTKGKAQLAKERLAKSGSIDDFADLLVQTGNADI
jgi:hypothetical protein